MSLCRRSWARERFITYKNFSTFHPFSYVKNESYFWKWLLRKVVAEGLWVQKEADGWVLEHAEQTVYFILFILFWMICHWLLRKLHKAKTIVLILLWWNALYFQRITALVLQQQQQSGRNISAKQNRMNFISISSRRPVSLCPASPHCTEDSERKIWGTLIITEKSCARWTDYHPVV